MDADRYQRIKLIFQAVREAPEVNRRDILEARCAGDLELREAVLKLLKSDGEAGGFLEPTERNEGDLEAILPAQIGPYRIDKRIGAGGMGVVFLATEPEPTRRKVAIKLIRSDLHDSGSMKRFETEQRALALMDHPGIANIFHAGVTAEGRPFFVMEYVQGVRSPTTATGRSRVLEREWSCSFMCAMPCNTRTTRV